MINRSAMIDESCAQCSTAVLAEFCCQPGLSSESEGVQGISTHGYESKVVITRCKSSRDIGDSTKARVGRLPTSFLYSESVLRGDLLSFF